MQREQRRRRGGLLLVLGVLIVAVAFPHLLPRAVAGSPVVAAVPGPPAVGNCVAAPVDGWPAGRPARGDLTYPAVATRPCGGRRDGEVIAVLRASQVARPSQPASDAESDLNADWCSTRLNGYLGLAADSSPTAQTAWQPLPSLTTAVAGPTPLQRAFGQHWLSCVAYVAGGPDGTAASYDRTLRAAYISGRLPRAAAQCLVSDDPQRPIEVPCSAPHQAELFGSGWSATPVTTLTPTCLELVRQLTGMPDPTAGGALTVETAQRRMQIITFGVDGSGKPAVGRATGETLIPVCMVAVADHRSLSGPLVDLGVAPVPWT